MKTGKIKQQSFEYGAIILLCSTVLVKIIGAIFKIPLSNLLGEVGRGYFYKAYDIFTPIYTLAMAGLPIAVSRIVSEHYTAGRYNDVRHSLKVTKRIFTVTGLIAFVVMVTFVYFFVFLKGNIAQSYSMFVIAPSLFLCCITSGYRGYFEGLRNMYPTAISDVIESLGKLILGLGFAYIIMELTNGNEALGASGAMLGIVIGGVGATLFLHFRYKIKGDGISESELETSPKSQTFKVAAKSLIAIAVPVALASLANTVTSFVDVIMVNWQLDRLAESSADFLREMYTSAIADYNSTREAGKLLKDSQLSTFLYGVRGNAFTLYNLAPTITSVLGVSALPVLASLWKKGDRAGLKRNMESTIKLTAIIAMPVGFGFVFLGHRIMELLYGDVASSQIGGPMLQIYGVAAMFTGLAIPMTSMLQAIGKEKISLRNVAVGAVLKVIVNFIFVGIVSINIKGAAIGTMVSYIFIFTANLTSLIKYTGIKPNLYKTVLKPFTAAIACGVTAFAVSKISSATMVTIVSIMAAAVVYLAVLILLNTFEEEDFLSLPKGEKLLKIAIRLNIVR